MIIDSYLLKWTYCRKQLFLQVEQTRCSGSTDCRDSRDESRRFLPKNGFQFLQPVLQWCLFVKGVSAVFYTTEEAAVLDGFLELYLGRDSVDAAVRRKCEKFRLDLLRECLGRDDYVWAAMALSFLRPYWWQDYEDRRALENALLKTQTLAMKTRA